MVGRLEEAVEVYEQYTELRPGNPLGYLELGFGYEEEGDLRKAIASWERIELSLIDFIEAGKRKLEIGNFDSAITWFQTAVLSFPQTADANYELGMAYQKGQHWAHAILAYDMALAQGAFQNVHLGDVYYQKGLIYQSAPEFTDIAQAFAMYDAALETGAFSSAFIHANGYYKRGEIYLWMNDHLEEAISDFQQAITLYPMHYLAHLRLGYTMYQASGDVQQAEAEILRAIELWPNLNQKEWPYRVLGEIYEAADWTDKAIAAYQEALNINPEDTKAQLSLKRLQGNSQEQP